MLVPKLHDILKLLLLQLPVNSLKHLTLSNHDKELKSKYFWIRKSVSGPTKNTLEAICVSAVVVLITGIAGRYHLRPSFVVYTFFGRLIGRVRRNADEEADWWPRHNFHRASSPSIYNDRHAARLGSSNVIDPAAPMNRARPRPSVTSHAVNHAR